MSTTRRANDLNTMYIDLCENTPTLRADAMRLARLYTARTVARVAKPTVAYGWVMQLANRGNVYTVQDYATGLSRVTGQRYTKAMVRAMMDHLAATGRAMFCIVGGTRVYGRALATEY